MVTREPLIADFRNMVDLWNQERPQEEMTIAKLTELVAIPAGYLQPGGVVAVDAGRVIGFGTYRWSQRLLDQPVKFWIDHLVSEAKHAKIQDDICCALEKTAKAFGQTVVYAIVREDNVERVEIYQQRGYREQMRSFGARLKVQQFDANPYRGHSEKLKKEGFEIKTLDALEQDASSRSSLHEKLFNVYVQTASDSPDVGGSGVATVEEYVRQNLEAERTVRDAYFVAVRGEEYVGLSELFSNSSPYRFDTGTTVVKHECRRLGVGLGLKLRAIAYAQAHDGKVITTGFAAKNQASVNLNRKLGFVFEPSWITFQKSVSEICLGRA
jgi:GNAT superfamily N-acetyltransferase